MGIPIKERGIRWTEAYGDKSAYLKEQYEEQVGPGSYFRWEGHDHTTGTDYYAVVTPGYSEKHGFHFFAALRKMPAKAGASGKKFKTQAEALSYAIETWRVPAPKTAPHKPYVAADLQGAPIVMENIHAELDIGMTKIAAEVKKGMAFMTSAPAGQVINNYGPKEYAADLRNAAAMNMIMGAGAALYTSKQWQVVDKQDQGPGDIFTEEGKRTRKIHTGLATCEPPSDALWSAVMNPEGIPTEKRLIKADRKSGTVQITPPRYPDAENTVNYQLVRFDNIINIMPTLRVGMERKAVFDQFVKGMEQDPEFRSKLLPGTGMAVVSESAPKELKRGNYSVTLSIPVDLFKRFQSVLDQNKLASVERMRWEDDNAIELYSHFLKTGQLETPDQIAKAMRTPVMEVSRPTQGQLIIYDQRGWPLGIKIKQSKRFDQEAASDDESLLDVMLPFKKGQVEALLSGAGGDIKALRSMLANNRIPLSKDMFVDGRTCAPKNRHIWAMMPDLDENAIPRTDANGQLVLRRRSLIDRYQITAPSGKVRVFNPATNREELKDIPKDVMPSQNVDGTPLITKGAKYYIPIQGPGGTEEWHEIDAGETRIYDPDSAGKFKNGAVFTVYAKPEKSSAKKSQIKDIQGKGQESLGFFAGHKKTLSDLLYRESPTIQDRHRASLYSIILPNGQEMVIPENPNTAPNDPALQYLSSNRPIAGYFYIGQRQYAPISFSAAANKKIERRKMDENGVLGPEIDASTGQPVPPLVIKENDISNVQGGVAYLSSMEAAISIIKATMGWDNKTVGRWTRATIDDLHAADDKVREVDTKIAAGVPPAQMTREEQIFAEFEKKGNEIPLAALQEFSRITDDPSFYMPRAGTVFEIQRRNSDGSTERVSDHLFVTKDKAELFMKMMASSGVTGDMFVSQIDNASMMLSTYKQENSGQAVTNNIDIKGTQPKIEDVEPEAAFPPKEEAPQAVSPAVQSAPPLEEASQEEIPSFFDFSPKEQVPESAQTEPAKPVAKPDHIFDFSAKKKEEEAKKESPIFDFGGIDALNRLVKIADNMDKSGKTEEANAIDRLIMIAAKRRPHA